MSVMLNMNYDDVCSASTLSKFEMVFAVIDFVDLSGETQLETTVTTTTTTSTATGKGSSNSSSVERVAQ